jgi:hypothetical protein
MTVWLRTTPTPSLGFDTTVVVLITDDNETAYREVSDLAVWCQNNNLSINISKTKS